MPMITEFLLYDLKVAVLIAAFYFCYRLLMERDTWHHTNRIVLLAGLVLSLVLPLCVITLHETAWVEVEPLPSEYPVEVAIVHDTAAPTDVQALLTTVLAWVVVAGIAGRLAYLLLSYWKLQHLLAGSERHLLDDGTVVAVTEEPTAPFSWMNTIVVNRHDYEEHNPLLLIHERSHIRLHHSYDVVFVELLTVLQWFNPVVWLLSRDLRTVHEYEADEAVLSQGFNMAQYISLLMTKATGIQACALANGINTSEIKKRIDMMIKRKSPRLSWLKGLYVVPIAALSLALTAKTVTDCRTLPTEEKPFALHAVVDQYGRITGFSSEGKPDTRWPLEYTIGRIFFDDREATLEEVKNYKSLGYEAYETIHNPNSAGDPKWNYKDKEGILVFHKKQDSEPGTDGVFSVCEEMPQFPGGVSKMMEYIMKNVKYPKEATEWGVQGKVIVKFIVEKDGRLTSPEIAKTTDLDVPSDIAVAASRKDMTEEQRKNADAQDAGVKAGTQALKDEAIRLVRQMPNWQPGKQRGKPVRVQFAIPVTFRLQ